MFRGLWGMLPSPCLTFQRRAKDNVILKSGSAMVQCDETHSKCYLATRSYPMLCSWQLEIR